MNRSVLIPEESRHSGPSDTRIVVGYGFWIFLLSDIIMFSAFFAAFSVLADTTEAKKLFHLTPVAFETGCLLLSSFTCGLSGIAFTRRNMLGVQLTLLITGLLGFIFLLLEAKEFADLAAHGNGPEKSAFLTSFFTLVGCHGMHIGVGLLWLGTMMAQIFAKGFRKNIERRLLCFNLFWHALDIVWIGIFTRVYLIGTLP